MKRTLVFVVVLVMIVSMFGAVSAQDGANELNWNLGADPKTMDPGLNGASDGGDVINQTFEGLVREKSGVVYPGIAESWETSEDGLTVTFHLRESKWSDGSDLTANDFVYSWLRAMDPATASEYAWIWEYTHVLNAAKYVASAANQAIIDAGVGALIDPEDEESGVYTQEDIDAATANLVSKEDVGVKAVDDLTFEVTLESPTDYLVSLMAFYHFKPVKQSAVEAGPEGTWASDPALFVSNGAFVLTEYTIGEGLRLEKNPYYWNAENVALNAINAKFIDIETTAYQAYMAGELDFIPGVPAEEIPRLIAEDPNFYVFPLLGTYYYSFNMDLPMWADNPMVRKAMAMAIDRELIAETLASGQVPAAGFIPPGFVDADGNDFFTTAGLYGFSMDDSSVEAAQALLAEAGFPNGEGFPEFSISYNTSETHQLIAEMVQEMWKTNLGLNVKLENQEWAVFQDTRKAGDFELSRGGWLTDFMDPSGMLGIFMPGNAYNDPNYDNAEFQAAIAEASAATDPHEHFAALYEAQDIFMNDLPIVPIYHYSDTMLASDVVVGWDRSVLGTVDFTGASLAR